MRGKEIPFRRCRGSRRGTEGNAVLDTTGGGVERKENEGKKSNGSGLSGKKRKIRRDVDVS